MYAIEFVAAASNDLASLRAFDRSAIVKAVARRLEHEPLTPARDRKLLAGMTPPFDAEPPVWQLKVGNHRVFYDVDAAEQKVMVRAIRHKPPHKTTKEIL